MSAPTAPCSSRQLCSHAPKRAPRNSSTAVCRREAHLNANSPTHSAALSPKNWLGKLLVGMTDHAKLNKYGRKSSMKATGYSTWSGSWKQGNGTISTETKTLNDVPYTFSSRFEGAPGASPE